MKVIRTSAVVTALAIAAGCAPMERGGNNGHSSTVVAATPTGPAVSCIPIVQISETRVRDDWTIDFRTAANRWYRNTLPQRCAPLGVERAFSYSTSLSQLCNVDIITVLHTGGAGPMRLGSCGLGQFQPVTLAK